MNKKCGRNYLLKGRIPQVNVSVAGLQGRQRNSVLSQLEIFPGTRIVLDDED